LITSSKTLLDRQIGGLDPTSYFVGILGGPSPDPREARPEGDQAPVIDPFAPGEDRRHAVAHGEVGQALAVGEECGRNRRTEGRLTRRSQWTN
jgi:hypothetical protein